MLKRHLYVLPVLLVVLSLTPIVPDAAGTATAQFESPLTPPESETPPQYSPQADLALQFLAEQEGLSPSDFHIYNEHDRSYPYLARRFKAFTIYALPSDKGFQVLVDINSGIE